MLTGMGDILARRARSIVLSVDEVGDMMRVGQDGLAGPFRLGVIPTIAPYLLPNVMKAVIQAFPDLDLNLRETITPKLEEELRAGSLDAAILGERNGTLDRTLVARQHDLPRVVVVGDLAHFAIGRGLCQGNRLLDIGAQQRAHRALPHGHRRLHRLSAQLEQPRRVG